MLRLAAKNGQDCLRSLYTTPLFVYESYFGWLKWNGGGICILMHEWDGGCHEVGRWPPILLQEAKKRNETPQSTITTQSFRRSGSEFSIFNILTCPSPRDVNIDMLLLRGVVWGRPAIFVRNCILKYFLPDKTEAEAVPSWRFPQGPAVRYCNDHERP